MESKHGCLFPSGSQGLSRNRRTGTETICSREEWLSSGKETN